MKNLPACLPTCSSLCALHSLLHNWAGCSLSLPTLQIRHSSNPFFEQETLTVGLLIFDHDRNHRPPGDLPVMVEFIVSDEEDDSLIAMVREERLHTFCTRTRTEAVAIG